MAERWIFRIYNLLLLLALPFIVLAVVLRWRKRILSKGFVRWDERWGRFNADLEKRFQGSQRWWWVHAVSMGEVKAIEAFLRRAPAHAGVKVLLSAVTPEALQWAGDQKVADEIIAAPIDLPWIVRKVFRTVRPEVFVSVESEFWPNLLREARRSGAQVALINGRLSVRSFGSYQKVRGILSALWSCFDLMAVREDQDASRFGALGVPLEKIKVTGNLKYDLLASGSAPAAVAFTQAPLIVLGSTREGEEQQLLPTIQTLRREWPNLRVIWAPRHVERVVEVENVLTQGGLAPARKSKSPKALDVVWDSMGDLLDAYRQADVAIIGGSFVQKGGQNPIEPAALGRPVVFGPSMENFHDISGTLVKEGAARQVPLSELASCLDGLLRNPDWRRQMGLQARRAVEIAQGATERTLKLLEALPRG